MSPSRAKLLVIDDEPDMLRMLALLLSLEGFEITPVNSGDLAVKALSREPFDLALTDLRMPGMDGFETIRALKAIDPDLEIVVATGYSTSDTSARLKKIGAFEMIQKPFNVDELTELLKRALAARAT